MYGDAKKWHGFCSPDDARFKSSMAQGPCVCKYSRCFGLQILLITQFNINGTTGEFWLHSHRCGRQPLPQKVIYTPWYILVPYILKYPSASGVCDIFPAISVTCLCSIYQILHRWAWLISRFGVLDAPTGQQFLVCGWFRWLQDPCSSFKR